MPDDLRAELQALAAKRGRSLTQELLWRLKVSFNRERIDRQDQVTRALCFLFTDLVERLQFRQEAKWHRDPFTFQAFKLAVGKLLDALEPAGEPKSPFILEDSDTQLAARSTTSMARQVAEWFRTPESAATHVATSTLESLFRPKKITEEEKAAVKQALENGEIGTDMVAEFEREYFAMDMVGRVLGIDQTHGLGVFRQK